MLRWYAALAILSRGSTTLGLLAVSFLVDKVEYGLIGMAFVAITTASQIFGYPGYLTALNSTQVDKAGCKYRWGIFLITLAFGAFSFVLTLFWSQMAYDHAGLLFVAALAAAALTVSTTMNGALQKLKHERFAAQNTGLFLVLFIAVAVLVSDLISFASIIVAIGLAHVLALASAVRYSRIKRVRLASLSFRYTDYGLFALSGLASSSLLVPAANLLFAHGGASEMGKFTLALQVRAILIFGAGVVGAEMLSRYSDAVKSEDLRMDVILEDFNTLLKWMCPPILATIFLVMTIDVGSYHPLFDREAVYGMIASGAFVCASVPFSRALTALYSEVGNVAINFVSSIVCVAILVLAPKSAESFSFVFASNSCITLFLLVGSLIYLVGWSGIRSVDSD